ncbi:hypothetical protein LR48_Vigan11g066100 [Vigna angularis]|uniref:Uncharacterized protein n=1 Tax=Phaseolus angularis TaxID=3914 RepID=A0A0L9VRQ5_PHAAN|nr:hypothetical protein LR48_Vigan11g066100 [Vigna angularis]
MSLFLLKGGVRIDQEVTEPSGGWPRIKGYEWASHDVGLYRSDYSTRDELQWWVDRSHIVRDMDDTRLIRLGVCNRNKKPRKMNALAVGRMTPKELEAMRIINTLPCCLNAHDFVECLGHEDFDQKAFGYMSLSAPHKTSFSSSHKSQGESSSKVRDPRTTSSSRASGSLKTRPEQVTVAVAQPATVVDLEPSDWTTLTVMAVLSSKKKRSRRKGRNPLPRGTVKREALYFPFPLGELINAALELTARGAMLTWCARELASRRGSRDLQAELDKEKKTSEALRTRTEALAIDHAGKILDAQAPFSPF